MKMLRPPVIVLALVILAIPPARAQDAAPAAPPTPTAPAASAAPVATPFRVPPGWRVKTLRGDEPRYCRKDVRLGSRFAKEECLTREQLELQLQVDAENAARVSQGARLCSSAPGCVNN